MATVYRSICERRGSSSSGQKARSNKVGPRKLTGTAARRATEGVNVRLLKVRSLSNVARCKAAAVNSRMWTVMEVYDDGTPVKCRQAGNELQQGKKLEYTDHAGQRLAKAGRALSTCKMVSVSSSYT